jgi:hypothetical protein
MKHCIHCDRAVQPTKFFSFAWFILWCLTFFGGIIYLVYYFMFKGKQCPICRGDDFKVKAGETQFVAWNDRENKLR